MCSTHLVYQKPLNGNSVGVVFGSFAPLHRGHLEMIYRAKKENEGGCIVVVCGCENDKGGAKLPFRLRYQYVREFFKDDDLVAVYGIDDGALGFCDYAYENWDVWLSEFYKIFVKAVDFPEYTTDHWYVGEKEYYDDLISLGKFCTLLDRSSLPISGTMIRENPLKYWDYIALPFRRVFSRNILIIGTASEGKSHLAMDLAKYFGTTYAHEWPRDYMEHYCIDDCDLDTETFVTFLQGQNRHIMEQIESSANRGICFVDSDANTTDMYAAHYGEREECTLAPENYLQFVYPLAQLYNQQLEWDRVFIIPPHGKFVDDHTRYMEDADIAQREEMFADMKSMVDNNPQMQGRIEVLWGSYQENFEDIKHYVNQMYERCGIHV